jgi:hypothetical protein
MTSLPPSFCVRMSVSQTFLSTISKNKFLRINTVHFCGLFKDAASVYNRHVER